MSKFKVGDCVVSRDNLYGMNVGDIFIVKGIITHLESYFITISICGEDKSILEYRFRPGVKEGRKKKLESIYGQV